MAIISIFIEILKVDLKFVYFSTHFKANSKWVFIISIHSGYVTKLVRLILYYMANHEVLTNEIKGAHYVQFWMHDVSLCGSSLSQTFARTSATIASTAVVLCIFSSSNIAGRGGT